MFQCCALCPNHCTILAPPLAIWSAMDGSCHTRYYQNCVTQYIKCSRTRPVHWLHIGKSWKIGKEWEGWGLKMVKNIFKLQIPLDLPVQEKKSGLLYIQVVVCLVGWLFVRRNFKIPPYLPVQQNFPRTRPDQTRPD